MCTVRVRVFLRCVDLSWAVMKRLEELADYNSATVKNSMGTVTGGRDNGAPVSGGVRVGVWG